MYEQNVRRDTNFYDSHAQYRNAYNLNHLWDGYESLKEVMQEEGKFSDLFRWLTFAIRGSSISSEGIFVS